MAEEEAAGTVNDLDDLDDLAARVAEAETDPWDEFGLPEARRSFWRRRFSIPVIGYIVIAAACVVWLVLASGDSRSRFLTGLLAGALIAAAFAAVRIWHGRRRPR